jgi:hypothetical protein
MNTVYVDKTGKAVIGRRKWSSDEKSFLERQHLLDISVKNKCLAALCTLEFGRLITENGIRGSLDRLRKDKRVPQYRDPKRVAAPRKMVTIPLPEPEPQTSFVAQSLLAIPDARMEDLNVNA